MKNHIILRSCLNVLFSTILISNYYFNVKTITILDINFKYIVIHSVCLPTLVLNDALLDFYNNIFE